MNVAAISQSLILAGESPEVDALARHAVPVPTQSSRRRLNASGKTSRDLAIQLTSVGDNADEAGRSRDTFANLSLRSPLDLYQRVQRTNSATGSAQLIDVFA